ncbi:hypothetical protein [Aeromicrobium sp. 179-A 4D2 NHS]|uniref:hypothetical protein n=1 Tax=Aeromicrobium sp. 179-A 4D2 NHS TaxID=3142375 RepID=UPI0039A361E1
MNWLKRLFGSNRDPVEVFTCEVCASPDVKRSGMWDFCPQGHQYIGARIDEEASA